MGSDNMGSDNMSSDNMSPGNGWLKAIAITPVKLATMEQVTTVDVTKDSGLAGDARGTRKDRQVTVLFESAWRAACAEMGEDLDWMLRRANLLVGGMETPQIHGGRLAVGPVELVITKETNPCALMEQQARGLFAALTPDWRGGVCCRVARGGHLTEGDPVRLLP